MSADASGNSHCSLRTRNTPPRHHSGEVTMRTASPAIVVVATCAIVLGGACAHANRPVMLDRPAGASVSRLSELPSLPGAHVVVLLRSGESIAGAIETIDGSALVLRAPDH